MSARDSSGSSGKKTRETTDDMPLFNAENMLIVIAGMGPITAIKYFRYMYRSSKINILQQAERLGGPILSLGNVEPQQRSDMIAPLSIMLPPKNRSPVFEPLLSDSPNLVRSPFGSRAPFDFFHSQTSRLSSNYTRNCKDN